MSGHIECEDCAKCRTVTESWCLDCDDWTCERGEDCADKEATQ